MCCQRKCSSKYFYRQLVAFTWMKRKDELAISQNSEFLAIGTTVERKDRIKKQTPWIQTTLPFFI
ncbi:MAG TPA: hypothetical protein VK426_05850 [Methanobacterium sp.]|nr:hypothetical protein [Methanobacterium sp.]